MIFVIWRDFDGVSIDEFKDNEIAKAGDFIMETLQMQEKGDNGTEILRVVKGKEVDYKVVERIKAISLDL